MISIVDLFHQTSDKGLAPETRKPKLGSCKKRQKSEENQRNRIERGQIRKFNESGGGYSEKRSCNKQIGTEYGRKKTYPQGKESRQPQ